MYNYLTGFRQGDEPTDDKSPTTLSLVLFKQSTLDALADECVPHAGTSEFQVHYRSIIVRLKNTTNELIVTVPTSFFNFEQTVSHASVGFETADEGAAATVALEGSQLVMPILLQEFPALQALQAYADHNGFEYSIIESNSGSIHRHPGDFSFSGIDRDKDPSEPGVIYRHLNAADAVKTDSVIYIASPTSPVKVVTTETRIVNVQETTNGIEGVYTEVPTITCILKDTTPATILVDTFISLLGDTDSENIILPYRFVYASGASKKTYPLTDEILTQFAATTDASSADLDNVIGTNIKARTFFAYGKKSAGKTTGIQVWHEGKLVAAEYDLVQRRYVPIKAAPTKTIPAVTHAHHVTEEELVQQQWSKNNYYDHY